MAFTHTGRASNRLSNIGRLVKLRETKIFWISESGEKFRKGSGSRTNDGPFSTTILDLRSVKPLDDSCAN